MRLDPTGTMPQIRRYERQLTKLFEDYRVEVERILDIRASILPLPTGVSEAPGVSAVAQDVPLGIKKLLNTKGIQAHLDQAALVKVRIPGDLIIDAETEKAYRKGIEYGNRQIKTWGRGISLGKAPIDARIIQALKDRSISDLKGITDVTGTRIMHTLTDGILRDREFKDITRDIVRNVDNVGIVRATTLVRTETMKAVNAGTRSRYEGAGVEQLERLEASDEKTCDDWPFSVGGRSFTGCGELDGQVFTLEEGAEIDAQTHPNCRGTWIPYNPPKGAKGEQEAPPGAEERPPPDIQNVIDKTGDQIRGQAYETAVVLDPKGDILIAKDGARDSVNFTPEELPKMAGAHFIHNHPSGNSFSFEDFNFAAYWKTADMRVVSREFDFVMTPGSEGWPDIGEVKRLFNRENDDLKAMFWARITSNEITPEAASKIHFHELWSAVAPKMGMTYQRIAL